MTRRRPGYRCWQRRWTIDAGAVMLEPARSLAQAVLDGGPGPRQFEDGRPARPDPLRDGFRDPAYHSGAAAILPTVWVVVRRADGRISGTSAPMARPAARAASRSATASPRPRAARAPGPRPRPPWSAACPRYRDPEDHGGHRRGQHTFPAAAGTAWLPGWMAAFRTRVRCATASTVSESGGSSSARLKFTGSSSFPKPHERGSRSSRHRSHWAVCRNLALPCAHTGLRRPLGPQRHERQVLLRVPPAALGRPRVPGPVLLCLLSAPVPRWPSNVVTSGWTSVNSALRMAIGNAPTTPTLARFRHRRRGRAAGADHVRAALVQPVAGHDESASARA